MPPTTSSSVITDFQNQNGVSAMMCDPSASDNNNPLLKLASSALSSNPTALSMQAQYALALQQHQHQHQQQQQQQQILQQQQQIQQQQQHQQQQLQQQHMLQQAAQSLQYSTMGPTPQTQQQQQQQQQQLMAQLIASGATSNQTAATLQAAVLLQQHQQQHQQQQILQQQLQYLAASQGQHHQMTTSPHNLIPKHLQDTTLEASMDGTPGYQPAVILPPTSTSLSSSSSSSSSPSGNNNNNNNTNNALPANNIITNSAPNHQPSNLNLDLNLDLGQLAQLAASIPWATAIPRAPLTLQEDMLCNSFPPIYNGVNLQYPGLRQLRSSPPVYVVDNFLTPAECQFLIHAATDVFQPAPVVGQGIGEISPSRTSSTCYLARDDLPEYLRKVRLLTGKPISHCELPQVGRYFPSQRYLQHFDAFDLSDANGRRFASNGGQRVVTVLVYLNTLTEEQGGATHFPNLNIKVQPQQGMALVFFPSTVDGLLDRQALHAALPPLGNATKYVSQVWIRQSDYKGDPSKRLNPIMGIQNYQPPSVMDVLQLKAAAGASCLT